MRDKRRDRPHIRIWSHILLQMANEIQCVHISMDSVESWHKKTQNLHEEPGRLGGVTRVDLGY